MTIDHINCVGPVKILFSPMYTKSNALFLLNVYNKQITLIQLNKYQKSCLVSVTFYKATQITS